MCIDVCMLAAHHRDRCAGVHAVRRGGGGVPDVTGAFWPERKEMIGASKLYAACEVCVAPPTVTIRSAAGPTPGSGHNYIGHNYTGHKYIGHNYIRLRQR